MPKWYQLSFTGLELKALWIRATGGVTEDDPVLHQAGENALDKVYRAEKGLPMAAPEKPESAKFRGPECYLPSPRAPRTRATCRESDCTQLVKARGLCARHYQRLRAVEMGGWP